MRLSMWILNDWLKKYHPEPKINDGKQILRSARILSNNITIERQNVYLADASEFIDGEKNKTICVQGQDYILLKTEDMNEVLNDIFDAFDYYNSWADSITEDIRNGCSAQDILDKSDIIFRQPILIYNSGNEIAGISSAYPKGSLDSEWDTILENRVNSLDFLKNIKDILKIQKTYHEVHHFTLPGTPYTSVYRGLFSNKAWIGRMILLESSHTLSEGESQLFNTMAGFVEKWASDNEKALVLREETAIFRDLIDGKPVSHEEMDHKLYMTGWMKEHRKQLVRIEVPQSDAELSRAVYLRMDMMFPDSYIIFSKNSVYALINLEMTHIDDVVKRIKPVLKDSGLNAVASYEFTDVYSLADYNRQCELASRYIPKEENNIFFCADYALDCIRSFIHTAVPGVLKHPCLEQLKKYDRENSANLYNTLYALLRNNCNVAQTARQLSLHRNSMLYRLNQIRELTGIDPDDANEREHLLISFYI